MESRHERGGPSSPSGLTLIVHLPRSFEPHQIVYKFVARSPLCAGFPVAC